MCTQKDDQITEPSSNSLHFSIGIAHPVYFFLITVSVLKHPRTSSNALAMMDYQSPEHEQLMKRLRSAQSGDEVLLYRAWICLYAVLDALFWVLWLCL